MVMNKGFAWNKTSVSGPVFTDDSVARELELIHKNTKFYDWQSPTGELLSVELPHTVYPPKEDTTFMAENLVRLGPGKGRKCLEIGVGSGVLSLLCHRQGWKVSGCDINPYSVVAAKRLFSLNSASDIQITEGGPGPKEDGEPLQWATKKNYELIFWNMPYLTPTLNDDSHLGPLEDAALIDTSTSNLISMTLAKIKLSNLLAKSGIGLFTVGEKFTQDYLEDICSKNGFSCRITNELHFDDGECLRIMAFWHPYSKSQSVHKDVVSSTNSELLANDWPIGSSLSTDFQTQGRGRYDRKWVNSSELMACSWKIEKPVDMPPPILQIICGHLIKQSLQSIDDIGNDSQIILKWPNDLIIVQGEKFGKVSGILVESASKGKVTHTVVGIGINISNNDNNLNEKFPIAYTNWFSNSATAEYLHNQIHCRIAGLFESIEGIPNTNFEFVKSMALSSIKEGFNSSRGLFYRKDKVNFENINDDGTISLRNEDGTHISCDEGEQLNWLFL